MSIRPSYPNKNENAKTRVLSGLTDKASHTLATYYTLHHPEGKRK